MYCRPMIGATEALGKIGMGIKNTVDPAEGKASQDKFKE